ncbi:MAG: hypothetical protein EU541_00100 [Promethearchaeota archaeon]|nr:MAG: hypothetical protein EU541_00100 [Candidatus Lokiarchaeota archaeon]
MTNKRVLSDKKITRQTISISPALRQAIISYIEDMQENNPNDDRYKSISAFFTFVMDKTLSALKSGKTLEDLEKIAHKDIRGFFDDITFKAIIPDLETSISLNKYIIPEYDQIPQLFLRSKELFIDKKDYSKGNVNNLFKEFNKYFISNRIINKSNIEVRGDSYSVEHIGNYKNLHFHNAKLIIGILGFLGFKINKIVYSEKENYIRYDIEPKPLFGKKDLLLEKRKELMKKNVKELVNFFRILDDNSCHLWIKMAKDNNIALKFKSPMAMEEWFSKIKQDIERFTSSQKSKAKGVLNFFKNINWITIINQEDLVFEFSLSIDKWKEEREFVLDRVSEYGELKNLGTQYQLII